MKRLVLIDGNAILHRAYHALPPLTTSKGELINAVFGFCSMLLKVIHDLKPTYLAICFDRPEPTFRKEIFEDYQAQRPKMEEELKSQVDLVKKLVKEMEIPIYEKPGYEADDVIGTLAAQAAKNQKSKIKNFETVIVTGDRDILQLVDKFTKVYMPVKGLSEAKLYGEKEVEEKFGIKPKQIVDFKALIGDPSDNYQGIKGIGPKTARLLLKNFGSLEEIYKKIKNQKSKVKSRLLAALAKDKEKARLAKKLAKIVTNVPIKLQLEKSRIKKLDRPEVRKLFEKLEFKSLISRLAKEKPKREKTKTDEQLSLI